LKTRNRVLEKDLNDLDKNTNSKINQDEEEEDKKDKCTCGKPLQPIKIAENCWGLKEVCVCGLEGKSIGPLRVGSVHSNIHGFTS